MSFLRLALRLFGWAALVVVVACVLGSPVRAQNSLFDSSQAWQAPVLSRTLDLYSSRTAPDLLSGSKSLRFPLFRIPTAFPSDPLGFEPDSDPFADDANSLSSDEAARNAEEDSWLQVNVGVDNPFFDLRLRGDPGGIGYYRFHSQVVLFDNGTAGMSMVLQALTPAGLEADGLEEGTTVFIPNFAWFCQLDKDTALQGFMGKNLQTGAHWTGALERQFCYGVGLERPLPGFDSSDCRGLHMFVEALGRYRWDDTTKGRLPGSVGLLPGLHWRVSDDWWVSGGVMMPVGPTRLDNRLWQITCSWRF